MLFRSLFNVDNALAAIAASYAMNSLIVFVHFVEDESDKFSLYHRIRGIESIPVRSGLSDEFGSAVFDAFIQFSYSSNKGIARRKYPLAET